MRICQYLFGLLLLILITNCSMIEYRDYEEFHKHEGTTQYEVKKIFSEEYAVKEVLLDKKKAQLVVYGETNPVKEEDRKFNSLKVSSIGNIIEDGPSYKILRDGTLKGYDFYINWIINGDTTKHRFRNPLSTNEKKDSDEWFEKFKELYDKASFIYIDSGVGKYYFKVNKEWFMMHNTFEEYVDLEKHFPAKEDQNVRMIELKDRTPDFSRGPTQRDTTLWTYHGYEEADSESGSGLNPINFSAGWHYLQLKIPGSAPLKIARYGSMGVNMHTYIIPEEYGGREDVVFIVQEPNELYPDQEHGGMYVIRPRELGEENQSQ